MEIKTNNEREEIIWKKFKGSRGDSRQEITLFKDDLKLVEIKSIHNLRLLIDESNDYGYKYIRYAFFIEQGTVERQYKRAKREKTIKRQFSLGMFSS